jgi:hypothetical protein
MNYSAAGATVDISIRRSSGIIEDYGKIHNRLGVQFLESSYRYIPTNNYNYINFYTQSASGRYSLSGDWIVTNGKVTRNSGSTVITSGYPVNGNLIVFGNGEQAYKLTNTPTVSSFDISKPLNISTPTSITVYKTNESGFGTSPATGSMQTKSMANLTTTYDHITPGTLRALVPSPIIFPDSTITHEVNCVCGQFAYGPVTFFELSSPLTLNVGDSLILNNYELLLYRDNVTPKTFSSGKLSGAATSGSYQFMSSIAQTNLTINRAYLVSDANKITLSSFRLNALPQLTNSNFTYFETLVSTGTAGYQNPSYANNMKDANGSTFTVVTGGLTKQILYGYSNYISGVIEFDTPQSIAPGKILKIIHSYIPAEP